MPNNMMLTMVTVAESWEIMPKLLIMNMVKGIWMKMYKITNMFIFRNGLRFDNERTTLQNIVVQGKAVATKMYQQKDRGLVVHFQQ